MRYSSPGKIAASWPNFVLKLPTNPRDLLCLYEFDVHWIHIDLSFLCCKQAKFNDYADAWDMLSLALTSL